MSTPTPTTSPTTAPTVATGAAAGEPGAEPGTTVVLARACAAEWSRIWSVRSTWLLVLATVLVTAGVSVLMGVDAAADGAADRPEAGAWLASRFAGGLALFALLALAAVTATADHGTGGIVSTLQWTPRRGVLLAARTGVIVVTTTLLGLVLAVAAAVVVWRFEPGLGLPPGEAAAVLTRVSYVHATGALLAVGLGLLTRSTAGALVSVVALVLVLPLLLTLLGFDSAQRIASSSQRS